MSAGRVLARTSQGLRFVPSLFAEKERIWNWRLDRIEARVDAKAEVHWRLVEDGGNALLFGLERGDDYASAMAEALGALLGSMKQ
jgi:transposase-like protein